jgi:hypothetical protein
VKPSIGCSPTTSSSAESHQATSVRRERHAEPGGIAFAASTPCCSPSATCWVTGWPQRAAAGHRRLALSMLTAAAVALPSAITDAAPGSTDSAALAAGAGVGSPRQSSPTSATSSRRSAIGSPSWPEQALGRPFRPKVSRLKVVTDPPPHHRRGLKLATPLAPATVRQLLC